MRIALKLLTLEQLVELLRLATVQHFDRSLLVKPTSNRRAPISASCQNLCKLGRPAANCLFLGQGAIELAPVA